MSLFNFKLPWNKNHNFPKGRQLIDYVRSLELPSEDYAVFGSGSMYLNGIKDLDHDIDIIARGSAWEKAASLVEPVDSAYHEGKVVILNNGKVEIYNEWLPGEWNIDSLIEEADIIEGIRFVNLDTVIEWKKMMNRPKDRKHLDLINKHLDDKERIVSNIPP